MPLLPGTSIWKLQHSDQYLEREIDLAAFGPQNRGVILIGDQNNIGPSQGVALTGLTRLRAKVILPTTGLVLSAGAGSLNLNAGYLSMTLSFPENAPFFLIGASASIGFFEAGTYPDVRVSCGWSQIGISIQQSMLDIRGMIQNGGFTVGFDYVDKTVAPVVGVTLGATATAPQS